MAKKVDKSTEHKIKDAAKKVFHKKGFAATRTRDIAEEAGINLALLNYYFRSKEKLFQIVMLETMQQFMHSMVGVFNNQESTLKQKVAAIAENYIELLKNEPEIPVFLMSELRLGKADFVETLQIKPMLMQSKFAEQYKLAVANNEIENLPMIQFIMNLMGLCVFPFMAAPFLKVIGNLQNQDFIDTMNARKALIPIWIEKMFFKL